MAGPWERYASPDNPAPAGPWAKYAEEGEQFSQADYGPEASFARNKAYAKPAPNGYLTHLEPADEAKFQDWVKQNKVPFDPSPTADYDMRGFYKGMQSGDPRAQTGTNRNDGKLHFGDYYKTPYHKSFSAESQWATKDAPQWNDQDQLVTPAGQVVFDEPAYVKATSPDDIQGQPAGSDPSLLDQAGRQVGLATRAVAQGVAGLATLPLDAGVGLVNGVKQLIAEGRGPRLNDFNPFAEKQGEMQMPSETFSKALDPLLPQPITASEKVAGFVESVLAGSRMPTGLPKTPASSPKQTSVRDATLKAAQQEGYVVPPSTTNPSMLNRALEGAGGKAATAQGASIKNQAVTNALARKAVGLANDTPITPDSLASLRTSAGRVYEEVASSGEIHADAQYLDDLASIGKGVDEITKSFPEANVGAAKQIGALVDSLLKDKFSARAAVEYVKQLRADARGHLSFQNAGDPAKRALGMAQREAASSLEDMVMRNLAEQGKPELATQFNQARKLIAVSHTVENALNESTGNVSAARLASQMQKGKPLSGELETAAKFAQAFPKAAKEVNESMPGISPLDYYGSIGAAGVLGNPHLLLLPALRMGIRNALLTPMGQTMAIRGADEIAETPSAIGVAASTATQIGRSQ